VFLHINTRNIEDILHVPPHATEKDQDEHQPESLPRRAAAANELHELVDEGWADVHGRHAREAERRGQYELRPEGQPQRDAHRVS
jgi:hypothetical protein